VRVVKPKFSAVQEHCHTKLLATRYSLSAIRYSLPFFFRLADLPTSRLADNLARQEPRPPNSFRPSPLVPRPVLTGGYENKAR